METLLRGLVGLVFCSVHVAGFAQYQKPPDYLCPEFGVYPCNCTAESDDGIAVECDNTNLASMAVGLRQATKVQIANLTITNCNMERLYGDVFRSNNIVKIIIRDTPIRDIANDTFIGVGEYLQEFQLINSRLKTFPAGAIQALSVVQKIIIDKSDLEELPTDAFFGLSKLKQIQVSNAKIGTLAKTVFNGQRGLKKLGLNNNNITNIVRGTFDFGQNLEHLGR